MVAGFPMGGEAKRVLSWVCIAPDACKYSCPICNPCNCINHTCHCGAKKLTLEAIIGQQGN